MIFSVDSTISALRAFGMKMGVAAHNIANLETEEFKKSRATLNEGRNHDVQVEISKIDTPGSHVMVPEGDGQMVEKELSNVDLAEEFLQTTLAQRGYEANLKSIKTLDEMLGTIIDIKG